MTDHLTSTQSIFMSTYLIRRIDVELWTQLSILIAKFDYLNDEFSRPDRLSCHDEFSLMLLNKSDYYNFAHRVISFVCVFSFSLENISQKKERSPWVKTMRKIDNKIIKQLEK